MSHKPGTIITCKSGTFMCYTYGQKVWKFHGERSGDKMPGEDEFSRPMPIQDGPSPQKRTHDSTDTDTRKLGRSCSTGSNYSSSESECSSQPSPMSETMEDVASGFLCPVSPTEEDAPILRSPDPPEQEGLKLLCPPPSPVENKKKVNIKALSDLINSLLKKHSLVQSGLELLKQKPALAIRLQQRRTRKVLADQGIIPPLKSPAAYYEQFQKLERARTGDILNKKMHDRPDRDFLVQKHILEDTSAYDSLVAHQKELKKAQLADDLNEKIFYRPGVFELVEKNIIPADETVTEALKGGRVQYKKTDDFTEEDSSDAFSPEQSSCHDQESSFGSPPPPLLSFVPSTLQGGLDLASGTSSTSWANTQVSLSLPITLNKQESMMVSSSSSSKMARSISSSHSTAGHPYLMRQTSGTKSSKITPSSLSQRNLRKKKEKPKFKKFKYHQYIPPDQGKIPEQALPDMDTPYSRLLEQQQLFLQLQIMNQQYPSLMAAQKSSNGNQRQEMSKNFAPPPPPPPAMNVPKVEKMKRSFTVQQLEEMKVAELKEELKARKEKVTGTKEVLVERLKRFAVPSPTQVPPNQPISESITGLINATIQSTIRANTEKALAAAVNNNGPAGALLLKARTMSPPAQQKQEGTQVLQTQISPPSSFAIQVVTSQSQQESRPVSVIPMDTQNQENPLLQPSTFHFAPTSNGVQIFSAGQQAISTNTVAGNVQLTSTTANNHFFNTANKPSPSQSTSKHPPNSSVPGQRVIAPAPRVQYEVENTPNQFDYMERQKDNLLHKQQQEIEDLKRMVELHRTQLHRIQEKERKHKQDLTNTNNNGSNSNMMSQAEQQEQTNMSMVELTVKRQHISQMLQKHLQNRLHNKDSPPPLVNGLNQQLPIVKQEAPSQLQANVFNFTTNTMPPNVSLVPLQSGENSSTVHTQQEDAPIVLSIKPPLERSLSESKEPPKYDQAIQMMHEEKRRLSHQSFGSQENMNSPAGGNEISNADMDDLLELLENKGEIPVTPTHQKSYPQTATVDHRIPQHATMHYHHYNQPQQLQQQQQNRAAEVAAHRRSMEQLHRTISCNEIDNTQQHHRRSLELPALIPLSDHSQGFHRKDPNIQRRHSGDLLDGNLQRRHSGDLLSYTVAHTGLTPLLGDTHTDFRSLLVSSAGDILMDATHVPPSNIQGRMNLPACISPEAVVLQQEPEMQGNAPPQDEQTKSNAYLNLNDPYTAQPFSPMDTGSCDVQRSNGMMEERVRDPHLSSSSIHDSAQSLDKCFEPVAMPQSSGSYLRRYEQPLARASPQRRSILTKSSSHELLSDGVPGFDHSMQVDELGWLDLTLSSPQHAPPSPMNLQHHRASMHSSMGSILEQDTGGNPYNLSGEGLGAGHNEFDLIDSLDLNSIGTTGIDSWDGL